MMLNPARNLLVCVLLLAAALSAQAHHVLGRPSYN